MTIMGPGDDLLRRLAEGADGGSEVCLQEDVLQRADKPERGEGEIVTITYSKRDELALFSSVALEDKLDVRNNRAHWRHGHKCHKDAACC